jgi:hypothetical protein
MPAKQINVPYILYTESCNIKNFIYLTMTENTTMDIILVKCINTIKLVVFCVQKQCMELVITLSIITTVLKDNTQQKSASFSAWSHVIKMETTVFTST